MVALGKVQGYYQLYINSLAYTVAFSITTRFVEAQGGTGGLMAAVNGAMVAAICIYAIDRLGHPDVVQHDALAGLAGAAQYALIAVNNIVLHFLGTITGTWAAAEFVSTDDPASTVITVTSLLLCMYLFKKTTGALVAVDG